MPDIFSSLKWSNVFIILKLSQYIQTVLTHPLVASNKKIKVGTSKSQPTLILCYIYDHFMIKIGLIWI